MHELDSESAEELDHLCKQLGSVGEQLRQAVRRVCKNPSGQQDPRHSYTKKFHNPQRYVRVSKHAKVMEFTTNQWRGLFQLVEVEKNATIHRLLAFIPIQGQRFFTVKDCPWH